MTPTLCTDLWPRAGPVPALVLHSELKLYLMPVVIFISVEAEMVLVRTSINCGLKSEADLLTAATLGHLTMLS